MKTLDRIIEIENKLNLNGGKGSGWWNPDHAMRVSSMFHSREMERAFKLSKSRSAMSGLVNAHSAYPTSKNAGLPNEDAAKDLVLKNINSGITSDALKNVSFFDMQKPGVQEKLRQDDQDFYEIKKLSNTIADESLNGKRGLGPTYVKSRYKEVKTKIENNIKYDRQLHNEHYITYFSQDGGKLKKIGEEESSDVKQNLLNQLGKAIDELYR